MQSMHLRLLFVDGDYRKEPSLGRAAAFSRLASHLEQHLQTRWVVGLRARDGAGPAPPGSLSVDLGASRSGNLRQGSLGLRSTLWLWRAVREAISEFRPDVVLVRGLEVPPLGVPSISVVRDIVSTGWEPDPVGRLGRWLAPWLRHIVVPTDAARRELLGLGVSDWRIERIPEVVELPEQVEPLGTDRQRLLVVHPGSIHPSKGQHLTIDAVHRLPRELKGRVELVVVGPVRDERYASQLRTAAAELPVRFEGMDQLAARVRTADLVAYPTAVNEGFADAAVQAMAWGRPVVHSDLPALREVLGSAGLAVPPEDVAALRQVIVSALDGLVDLAAIGARGRQWVASRLTWEVLWPKWRMLLAKVAG